LLQGLLQVDLIYRIAHPQRPLLRSLATGLRCATGA
jgi:hypothetical protein